MCSDVEPSARLHFLASGEAIACNKYPQHAYCIFYSKKNVRDDGRIINGSRKVVKLG
jgi:hypothetical protein